MGVPCENCAEVGAFHWRWHHDKLSARSRNVQLALATCLGGMVITLVAGAIVVLRLGVVSRPRTDSIEQEEEGMCLVRVVPGQQRDSRRSDQQRTLIFDGTQGAVECSGGVHVL